MNPNTLLAFAGVSLALVIIPGPNAIYILTSSADHGRRAGLVSALAVEAATLVHIALAVLGVGALVAGSEIAFAILKYGGAAYLAYLAVRAFRRPAAQPGAAAAASPSAGRVFRDGFLVNLLNPKVVLFFLALLPQFVTDAGNARAEMLVLGGVFFAIALTLDLGYALAGGLLRALFTRHTGALRLQHAAVGAVYLGLGAYAAFA